MLQTSRRSPLANVAASAFPIFCPFPPPPYLPLSKTAELTRPSAADIISTVEFDHTGNYLATGDKGGRVVLFERNETVSPPRRLALQQEISLTRAYLGANGTRTDLEKNLRIQIPYRIPISRTRI